MELCQLDAIYNFGFSMYSRLIFRFVMFFIEFYSHNSRMCFKLDARGGGVPAWWAPRPRPFFRSIKPILFARALIKMAQRLVAFNTHQIGPNLLPNVRDNTNQIGPNLLPNSVPEPFVWCLVGLFGTNRNVPSGLHIGPKCSSCFSYLPHVRSPRSTSPSSSA